MLAHAHSHYHLAAVHRLHVAVDGASHSVAVLVAVPMLYLLPQHCVLLQVVAALSMVSKVGVAVHHAGVGAVRAQLSPIAAAAVVPCWVHGLVTAAATAAAVVVAAVTLVLVACAVAP